MLLYKSQAEYLSECEPIDMVIYTLINFIGNDREPYMHLQMGMGLSHSPFSLFPYE